MAKVKNAGQWTKKRRFPGWKPALLSAATAAISNTLSNTLKSYTENEKSQNQDTRTNLNSTFNATSLLTKTSNKRKRKSVAAKRTLKKKRTFTKKIKKIVRATFPTSYWRLNFTTSHVNTNPGTANRILQNVEGITITPDNCFYIGCGRLLDNNNKDVKRIVTFMDRAGHVESGVAIDDVGKNYENIKFWFSGELHMDLQCFNVEFTDSNPLYIDIYECVAKRNILEAQYATAALAWENLLADQDLTHVTIVKRSVTNKGETPQKCKDFSLYWKIEAVTRVRIASPAPFHISMKTSGVYNGKLHDQAYAIKDVTKSMFYVIAPIQVTTVPANYNIQLSGVHKFLKYKPIFSGGAQYPSISFSDVSDVPITN